MCGYIGNTTDSPLTQTLMEILGIDDGVSALTDNPGSGPATLIDIIFADRNLQPSEPKVHSATWWLLLENCPVKGLKPSRYTSFNTRSDKLDQPRSAGYKPFRQSRCIIPASYIIEGEGSKGNRHYHRIEPLHCGFALGGLYRQWFNPQTTETQYSCSVITLPPHPLWRDIHSKSTPLFLPTDDPDLLQRWLDPANTDILAFQSLLEPRFRDELLITPVERPGKQSVTGSPWQLAEEY